MREATDEEYACGLCGVFGRRETLDVDAILESLRLSRSGDHFSVFLRHRDDGADLFPGGLLEPDPTFLLLLGLPIATLPEHLGVEIVGDVVFDEERFCRRAVWRIHGHLREFELNDSGLPFVASLLERGVKF